MNSAMSEPELVWRFFGEKTEGFFIDVGANDPFVMSQTWHLEQQGWRGILVEALPALASRLQASRPGCQVFQVACGPPDHPESVDFYEAAGSGLSSLQKNAIGGTAGYVAVHKVPMLSLSEIITRADCPKIDFLSIDVEGAEFDVVRGLDLTRNRPSLVFIEDHLYHLRTHRLLLRAGYQLVKRTGLNNWYVPKGTPFPFSSVLERLKLWRKVWPGTPVRRLKERLRQRAQ
jgi:FkbM family methyltransferase